ncbi:YebC/PmpR family DNA-binding transcriptional regulator [Aeoliella sp.]|uniref:YebC/PmpR family DNA-binding transcriptional regulator n=1 Tax=Aeoliella sp. TaxID=2795800 RepID=UPI003CCB774E
MAGHSHWANIARKKSAVDAKRGKLWSKLSKAIIVAARMGGGDPDANLRLRYAINDAKAVSMPKDNIERAIKKGTGELDGGNLEEVLYEGIGPAGVAIMCDILTDNRNRTAPEIRKMFEVCGGKLGATGCAAWTFDRKGVILISADKTDEESLMELAIEAGADDVRRDGDSFEVTCEPDAYSDVCDAVAAADLETESRELTWVPKDTIDLAVGDARNVLKLMERLDDHDDVQSVAANFDISDEVMAEIDAED